MLVSPAGIVRLTLPRSTEKAALEELNPGPEDARMSFERFDEAVTRIREYFRGKRVDFEDKLDVSPASDFQKKVWAICRSIPYGETRSYGWIASQIGKPGASRAVGCALAKNPIPIIIPCHSVVSAKGAIGGFSGGLPAKRRLLKLEGIKLEDNPPEET
jgi:methylated-DNA-[protein]-cysteine S-methyltransferase